MPAKSGKGGCPNHGQRKGGRMSLVLANRMGQELTSFMNGPLAQLHTF